MLPPGLDQPKPAPVRGGTGLPHPGIGLRSARDTPPDRDTRPASAPQCGGPGTPPRTPYLRGVEGGTCGLPNLSVGFCCGILNEYNFVRTFKYVKK